jgi:hypothetical protein
MTEEQGDLSEEDQVLARHRAFAEVLRGERPMGWSDWAMPIYESKSLTPVGKPAALQAVETLRQFFGDDFLTTAVGNGGHPLFTLGVWPANDVPWIYANLFRLVAQIGFRGTGFRKVQMALRNHLESHLWIHSLLQLEVAGMGVKAGWVHAYEPELGTGKLADVLLTKGPDRMLVEMKSLRLSNREAEAMAAFDRLFHVVMSLGELPVRISGSMGDDRFSSEEEARWFQEITSTAQEVAKDGVTRRVQGPRGAIWRSSRMTREGETAGSKAHQSRPTTGTDSSRQSKIRTTGRKMADLSGCAWRNQPCYGGLSPSRE